MGFLPDEDIAEAFGGFGFWHERVVVIGALSSRCFLAKKRRFLRNEVEAENSQPIRAESEFAG